MTKTEMSPNLLTQLNRVVRRLQNNRDFMAYVLVQYQKQERLSDDELIEYLHTKPEILPRLALCKRPNSQSSQFASQINQIAAYTGLDAAQLAHIVRQVDFLEKLSSHSQSTQPTKQGTSQRTNLYPGLAAAARDRSELTEDNSSEVEDNESSSEE